MDANNQKQTIPNCAKKAQILKWYSAIPDREVINEINIILMSNGRSIRVHHLLHKEIIKLFEIFGKPDCFTEEAYQNYFKSYEILKNQENATKIN